MTDLTSAAGVTDAVDPANAAPFIAAARVRVDEATGTQLTAHIDAGSEHHTPWGVVHGGLYTMAVESAASIGASLAVQEQGMFAVGLANHTDFLRAHKEGRLDVRAWAIHQGRTGQQWQCDITRSDGKLVAQGRVRLQNVPM